MYSSNIGAARMAMVVGIDVPEGLHAPSSACCAPRRPRAAGGRQAAVPRGLAADQQHDHRLRPRHRGQRRCIWSPAVAAWSMAALLRPATLIKRVARRASDRRPRHLVQDLRQDALADASGGRGGHRHEAPMRRAICVGGKTGTAEKRAGRGYEANARLASFVGAFPIDDAALRRAGVMLDEPKAERRSPTALPPAAGSRPRSSRRIVQRIGADWSVSRPSRGLARRRRTRC